MNKHISRLSKWCIAGCLAVLAGGGVPRASAQGVASRHTVQAGETLYRISKAYGVAVEEIVRANPGLTAENLKKGSTIVIPGIAQSGQTTAAGQPAIRITHVVKAKETLWGISQAYGITLDELVQANPEMMVAGYELKTGSKVLIPFQSQKNAGQPPATPVVTQRAERTTVSVAVLMPLKSAGSVGSRCLEYYRGFLMAVEQLKNAGKNVNVFAYDEDPTGATLTGALDKIKAAGAELIVGPVYPQHFATVADFARREGVNVLVPFSSKVAQVETCTRIYMMNAPDKYKHTYAADLFMHTFAKRDKIIFLRSAGGNERTFCEYLKTRLSAAGYETYYLPETFDNAQLKGLLSPSQRAVLVPDDCSKATLDDLLPRLRTFKESYPGFQTALFGYPEWQTYVAAHQNDFFRANTYVFTNFYYNVYDQATRTFEDRYRAWFHTSPIDTYPRMSLLGYDSGLYMMKGILTHGADFAGQDVAIVPRQSDMHFEKAGTDGGYVNSSIWFIHYKPDKSIERLEIKH